MKRFYIEFGRIVQERRRKAGLTQEALAKRVKMSRTSVTNIEKGRQQLPLHMLNAFADALGVEPPALLPDKKSLTSETKRVTIDLKDLRPDVAEFVGRLAQNES